VGSRDQCSHDWTGGPSAAFCRERHGFRNFRLTRQPDLWILSCPLTPFPEILALVAASGAELISERTDAMARTHRALASPR
jgi:predicted DNA-binding transcriptional regulator YafY